jgi:Spy/CpxP family protein refolding chaperone
MKTIALLLLLALCAFTQAPKQSPGAATTAGTCSPATTGSSNQITINCTNLTPEQRQIILNVPDLINKLSVQQREYFRTRFTAGCLHRAGIATVCHARAKRQNHCRTRESRRYA